MIVGRKDVALAVKVMVDDEVQVRTHTAERQCVRRYPLNTDSSFAFSGNARIGYALGSDVGLDGVPHRRWKLPYRDDRCEPLRGERARWSRG